MKKILAFLISCLLMIAMAACGNAQPVETTQPTEPMMQYYFMTGNGATVGYEKYTTRWGDSCLITFPDGKHMLIDTGIQDFYPILKETLEKLNIKTIDYMVFSHPHNDHCGGAWQGLFEDFTISQVYHNGAKNVEWRDERHIEAVCEKYNVPCTVWTAGDTAAFGEVTMQVLWPTEEARLQIQDDPADPAVNMLSLVMRFDYGEHSSLFTGDIYQKRNAKTMDVQVEGFDGAEELILKSEYKKLLDVDLLKMPHHGNPLTSASISFLSAVSPKFAVATSFEPVQPYMSYYKDRGMTCPVYFDRLYGQITIEATADGAMKPILERTDYLPNFGADWAKEEKIIK